MTFATWRRTRAAIARDQFYAWYMTWKEIKPPDRYEAGRAFSFWRRKWRVYGHDRD
jgi:hypothetical protein